MKRPAIALLLSVVLCACAPFSEGGGRGGPPGDGSDTTSDRRRTSTTSVTDQQQVLLAEIAAELKLTPRQLVLWESYQQRVGALMADQLRPEPLSNRRLSAPQQIDSRVETVRHRLTAIEEVQDAANAVYAALDVQQRKVADQRLATTVPALYSGLISCFSAEPLRDSPGGGPGGSPPRR